MIKDTIYTVTFHSWIHQMGVNKDYKPKKHIILLGFGPFLWNSLIFLCVCHLPGSLFWLHYQNYVLPLCALPLSCPYLYCVYLILYVFLLIDYEILMAGPVMLIIVCLASRNYLIYNRCFKNIHLENVSVNLLINDLLV
jgi:hypothetical protein